MKWEIAPASKICSHPKFVYKFVYGRSRWLRRLKFAGLAVAYGVLSLSVASFTALYSMVTL